MCIRDRTSSDSPPQSSDRSDAASSDSPPGVEPHTDNVQYEEGSQQIEGESQESADSLIESGVVTDQGVK